jgi:mRNA-degrading endonuclease RelE of RelBE toxin-antitoxin system
MEHWEKLLQRMPSKQRSRILTVLRCLRDEECRTTLDIKKLTGSDVYFRIRVGCYRVIFEMSEESINVIDVRLRNERTYKDLL